jgi:hypothetical protein
MEKVARRPVQLSVT